MSKIELDNVSTGFQSTTKINSNNDALETELNDKVLYRDNPVGEPNQMLGNLDMNSNRMLNLLDASNPQEPATLAQLTAAAAGFFEASMLEYDQQGTGSVVRSVGARLRDYVSPKDFGALGDALQNDAPMFVLANSNGEGVIVPPGLYKISDNINISEDILFMPGAVLTVDSGKTFTVSGNAIAGNTQAVFTGSGSAVLNQNTYSIHWFSTVAMALRSSVAGDNIQIHKNTSFEGVDITKKVSFWGVGREFLEVTGSFSMTGTGGNSGFHNIHLSTPSTTEMITVSGVGGMNFRDCQLNPGAGNFMFDWDRDGTTPQIVELMQTKFISGKLCKNSSAGQTHTFHVKESSLFSFTEADTLTPFAGSFIALAIYNSLVNINDPDISSASNVQLKIHAGCTIDDNTTNVAWYDNNGTGFDVLEVDSNVTMTFDSAQRFLTMAPRYVGSGVSAAHSNSQTVPSVALLTFDADLFDTVFFEGTATPLTFVQSWVMDAGAGQFENQSFKLVITGSIDTQGNTVNMFGRSLSPASQELNGLTVWGVYDGAAWTYSYSDLI